MYKFYLTCPRGLEEVLYNETKDYISQTINIDNGGITSSGNLEDIYRINYKTRIGMNLHVELFQGDISNYNDLYQTIYNFNWWFVYRMLSSYYDLSRFIIIKQCESRNDNRWSTKDNG